MNNKERFEKIKSNEKRIEELTKQRNETMRKLMKLYEIEKKKGGIRND